MVSPYTGAPSGMSAGSAAYAGAALSAGSGPEAVRQSGPGGSAAQAWLPGKARPADCAATPVGSIWIVPPSWACDMLSAAARKGEVLEYPSPSAARSAPVGALT